MGAVRRFGRQLGNRYIGPSATQLIEQTLFKKSKKGPVLSPGKALKSTALGSYLDKRYTRKCGMEVKVYDVYWNAQSIGGTIAYLPLASTAVGVNVGIAQGLTNITRVGDTIETKCLKIKGHFYTAATTTTPGLIRIVVIRQGAMAGTQLNPAQYLASVTNINSQLTLKADRTEPFQVLHDSTHAISLVGADRGISRFNFTWRPKGCSPTTWSAADTTGALGNFTEGLISVYAMYTGCATTAPLFTGTGRFEYVDV